MDYMIDLQGQKMPALGFGTWELKGEDCIRGVHMALDIGYRHIDTAQAYGNEEQVGEGLRMAAKDGITRDKFFLTTKIFRDQFESEEKALKSVEESLEKLGTDHVDLLLVHWPFAEYSIEQLIAPVMKAQEKGMTKLIGVSNFTTDHMKQAKEISGGKVCVNQVEYHPTLSQKPVLDFVRDNNWALTAYSPLGRGKDLDNQTIKEIADAKGKSPVQICLRWLIQQDRVSCIPKSSSREHIQSNFDIFDFELDESEMKRISALGSQNNRIVDPPFAPDWDEPVKQAA